MTQDQGTLADRLEPLDIEAVAEVVGRSMRDGEFGARLAGIDFDGDTLAASVKAEVGKALSISFGELLVRSWKWLRQVSELTGPAGPVDGEPREVILAGHTITARHVPEIHVELAGLADLRKISVPVEMALKVSGVALEITDRKISAVRAGQLDPKVTVKVESATVLDRALPRIVLADLFAAGAPDPEPPPGASDQAPSAPPPG